MRGFKTARSLAGALAIDENRYTRYERAEVEPDIGLIQRICETLKLSPNELFGVSQERPAPAQPVAPQEFAEAGSGYSSLNEPNGRDDRARASWLLACTVAELQCNASPGALDSQQPLAKLQQVARLFTDLERRTYATISEILLLPAVVHASDQDAQYIGKLVEELTRSPL